VSAPTSAVLATYGRNGFVEGEHRGHAVVLDPVGAVRMSWGDPDHLMMARSSAKPMQAAVMVRSGLELPDDLLALAASSHSGESLHLNGVLRILDSVGLNVDALQTPADYPLEPRARDAWIQSGRRASPLGMNCSGKHAAMLATCVGRGWDTATYLDPQHPLQQAILKEVRRMTDDEISEVGIDGCGAPVHVMTLSGLARAVGASVTAEESSPRRRVVEAMRSNPEMVGGRHRDVTAFMRAVPGMVAKDGAEGVYVAALSDGTSIAMKVDDGAARGRQVALARILQLLEPEGADADALARLAEIPLLGGGQPVGVVTSTLRA
jgi:L-asparaginase II